MTYEQAIESNVTFEEAQSEIEAHGVSMDEFTAEYGIADEYAGADVLAWLGY